MMSVTGSDSLKVSRQLVKKKKNFKISSTDRCGDWGYEIEIVFNYTSHINHRKKCIYTFVCVCVCINKEKICAYGRWERREKSVVDPVHDLGIRFSSRPRRRIWKFLSRGNRTDVSGEGSTRGGGGNQAVLINGQILYLLLSYYVYARVYDSGRVTDGQTDDYKIAHEHDVNIYTYQTHVRAIYGALYTYTYYIIIHTLFIHYTYYIYVLYTYTVLHYSCEWAYIIQTTTCR